MNFDIWSVLLVISTAILSVYIGMLVGYKKGYKEARIAIAVAILEQAMTNKKDMEDATCSDAPTSS